MSLLRTTISDARSARATSRPANLVSGNVSPKSNIALSGENYQIRPIELTSQESSTSKILTDSNQGLSNHSDNSTTQEGGINQLIPSVQPVTKVSVEDRNDYMTNLESDFVNHEVSSEIDIHDVKDENEVPKITSGKTSELNTIINEDVEIVSTNTNDINTHFDDININENIDNETSPHHNDDEYSKVPQNNDSIEINNTYTIHNSNESNLSSDEIEESQNTDILSENNNLKSDSVESYIPDREPENIKNDSIQNDISEIENESEKHIDKSFTFENKFKEKYVNNGSESGNKTTEFNVPDKIIHEYKNESDIRLDDDLEKNKNERTNKNHREENNQVRDQQEVSMQKTPADYLQKVDSYKVPEPRNNSEAVNAFNTATAITNKQSDHVTTTSHQELNKAHKNHLPAVKAIKHKAAKSRVQVNDIVEHLPEINHVQSDKKENHDVQIIKASKSPANHGKTQNASSQHGRSQQTKSPEVSIGQVDVYIESHAKPEQKKRSTSTNHSSSLSSRLYLRRL